jgi:hypothetical protein
MAGDQPSRERLEAALQAQVHQGERYVPFGELTLADVEGLAASIGAVGAWGPLQRAAKVARAWTDLAGEMRRGAAGTVAELEPATVVRFAEHTWVIPPESGMI